MLTNTVPQDPLERGDAALPDCDPREYDPGPGFAQRAQLDVIQQDVGDPPIRRAGPEDATQIRLIASQSAIPLARDFEDELSVIARRLGDPRYVVLLADDRLPDGLPGLAGGFLMAHADQDADGEPGVRLEALVAPCSLVRVRLWLTLTSWAESYGRGVWVMPLAGEPMFPEEECPTPAKQGPTSEQLAGELSLEEIEESIRVSSSCASHALVTRRTGFLIDSLDTGLRYARALDYKLRRVSPQKFQAWTDAGQARSAPDEEGVPSCARAMQAPSRPPVGMGLAPMPPQPREYI